MLKFRATEGLEAYISHVGCLVLKQDSIIDGKEVTIILAPHQAWEVHRMIVDFWEQMVADWDGGLIKENQNEQSSDK